MHCSCNLGYACWRSISVEYFKEFASNPNNAIVFVCYQGVGSLGKTSSGWSKRNKNAC